ncbi:ATP-dependent zinc metalloprotease FtsH [Inquilinus sp.]|uniref:ATP-dependent zinc metalloprotease FtsH n=1 Tax=Inquilinus sp. TaxID=1932117 RepID=UPI0031E03D27
MDIKKEHHINFWYVIGSILAILLVQNLLTQSSRVETIPYSAFLDLVRDGKVTDLVIGPTRITGSYREPRAGKPQEFTTVRVEPDLSEALAKSNVTFSGEPEPGLFETVLGWLLPTVGFILLWLFLVRPLTLGQGAGGLLSIGKSRAKVYVEQDVGVRFADVAGVDEAKEELTEVVAFLKDPAGHGRLGARVPKGVLLVGPPGTGKTLLARAVAGEAGVPFFSISGSEFVEMFVGVGAARVRDLFEQARQNAPAIVFIDELDALGRARGAFFPGGGHDEKEQTLNQLLAELDGFDPSVGVVLLAATNRPEILDPALLRAGRFDRQILVDRPDKKGRIDILQVHIRKIKIATTVSIEAVAALTPGFTGADIANLVNEAALLATRRNAGCVTFEDFTQAIERIVAGLEKRNRLLNPHERTVVAHHEMGHAIVAMATPGADPVQKISIIPRGITALGYTMQRPIEDRFLMDRSELANRMAVLLGGRAAESLVFGEISTGAADDLAKATDIARNMAARFGMVSGLGQVAYETEQATFLGGSAETGWQPRRYGEATAEAIDAAIRSLIDTAFRQATSVLTANRSLLLQAVAELMAKETIAGADLDAIAAKVAATPDGAKPKAIAAVTTP